VKKAVTFVRAKAYLEDVKSTLYLSQIAPPPHEELKRLEAIKSDLNNPKSADPIVAVNDINNLLENRQTWQGVY